MKLQNFKNFNINESSSDGQLVSNARFPDMVSLLNDIKEKCGPAFVRFCQKNNIPVKNATIEVESNNASHYIALRNAPLESKDLGIFANCMSKVLFSFFSGREIICFNEAGVFKFRPHVWTTLNVSYEVIKGGSNGVEYVIDPTYPDELVAQRSDIWYNIVKGEWESYNEHNAEQLEHRASRRLAKLNNDTGTFEKD